MQAYEPLQGIQNYFKKEKNKKMHFQILKVTINSKVKIILENRL